MDISKENKQDNELKIATSLRLWQLLFPNMQQLSARSRKVGRDKLTRAEVFFDLIQRQHLAMITGNEDFTNVSILSLSESWGWYRPTAKKFLEELEEAGAIILRSDGNRTYVRLTNILGDNISFPVGTTDVDR